MNIFKSVTLKWWQEVLFKIAAVGIGIVAGAYWHLFFTPVILPIFIIAIFCGLYILYVWLKE